MKKAGIFLNLGFIMLSAATFCSTAHAQSGTYPKKKDVGTTTTSQGRTQPNEIQNNSSKSVVANTQNNPKLITPVDGPAKNASTVSGARNCEPKTINKPYSITRADFNKLPKDRQQFVLSNLNKYTIVD